MYASYSQFYRGVKELFFFLLSFGGSNLSQINLFEKCWLLCLLPFAFDGESANIQELPAVLEKTKQIQKNMNAPGFQKVLSSPFGWSIWWHVYLKRLIYFCLFIYQRFLSEAIYKWGSELLQEQQYSIVVKKEYTRTQNNGNNQSNYARRIRLKKLKSASLRYRRDASQRSESGGTWSWIDFCTTLMFKIGRLCP